MFEGYAEAARRALSVARQEASRAGSEFIETEHFLLGLLREDAALAGRIERGSNLEAMRSAILDPAAPAGSPGADPPLSDAMKRVLAHAMEDAKALGQRRIGTEHQLLSLLRESDCRAARFLRENGIDRRRIWHELAQGTTLPDPAQPADLGLPQAPGGPRAATPPMVPVRLPRIQDEIWGRPAQDLRRETSPPARVETWIDGTNGGLRDGHFSTSRVENGAVVIETQHFHHGHKITVVERLRLSRDGKTLSFSQEIRGPKQEQRHAIDFDVS